MTQDEAARMAISEVVTGEVLGIGKSLAEALYKGLVAAGCASWFLA
jgi:hypothetical protein